MENNLVAEWYSYNLSEQERKAIVGNLAGAMEYGLTRSWNMFDFLTELFWSCLNG